MRRKTRIGLFPMLLAVAVFGCEASGDGGPPDARAIYSGHSTPIEMTFEIDADGDLRVDMEAGTKWFLRTGDNTYFVISRDGQNHVIDANMMAEIISDAIPAELAEVMAELDPALISLEMTGEQTIHGRTGQGYRLVPGIPGQENFVISSDPDLFILRDAMAWQFEMSLRMSPVNDQAFDQVLELLEEGAPLRFGNVDLTQFERVDIDDSRFSISSPPLSREEARALMIEEGMISAEPIEIPDLNQ